MLPEIKLHESSLTEWTLCDHSACSVTEWSNSCFVLCRNSELVLSAFCQLTQRILHFVDCLTGCTCPTDRIPVLLLDLVADDWRTTIRPRRGPGKSDLLGVDAGDVWLGWGIRKTWFERCQALFVRGNAE